MTSKNLIAVMMCAAFVEGALALWFEGLRGVSKDMLFWGPALINITLIFLWVRADATQRNYKRSPLLNIGIVVAAILAVPYYLVRSRPQGARLKAVGGCFLACVGLFMSAFAGGFVVALVRL